MVRLYFVHALFVIFLFLIAEGITAGEAGGLKLEIVSSMIGLSLF